MGSGHPRLQVLPNTCNFSIKIFITRSKSTDPSSMAKRQIERMLSMLLLQMRWWPLESHCKLDCRIIELCLLLCICVNDEYQS